MPKKLIVYTALFGDYDNLPEPCGLFDDCEFICFTDQARLPKSKHWKVVLIKDSPLSPALMNRMYKILPHRFLDGYEFSLYIDSNIEILSDPSKTLGALKEDSFNIVIPSHFSRRCLFEEAFVLIRSGRVNIKQVFKQTFKFILSGFYCQTIMGENNVILRRHNSLVDFSEYWWKVFIEGPHRDQLSLSYVAWKTNTPILISDRISSRRSRYFLIRAHKQLLKVSSIHRLYLFLFFAVPYYIFVKLLLAFFSMKNALFGRAFPVSKNSVL